ncbi:Dynamin-A [Astathelohania contejeani]|uniref:Dynamin-A n=1 Tax=Astathelohania contejeani TaxID=164912 RepID=A0ABQ7HZU3_9MICR|nr:Dynamin-A [Thelohania contejeani]
MRKPAVMDQSLIIDKVSKLQEIFSANDISVPLPRVVVIGSQSTGKSSVLEQILLKEFLPRGCDLVTRCPIIFHLRKTTEKNEYVRFAHSDLIYDLSTISSEIIKRMEALCGINKNIINEPIVLFVYLFTTPELTLVDLPGLTKIPMEDQPEDIESQIEEMVIEYIKEESTLILAVVSANVDIANCESIKISRRVDPQGNRTLAVVTKIDLMDRSTDCLSLLENKNPCIGLGYVGVINRGQDDINRGVDIASALKKEDTFFKNHPKYKKLYPRIGSRYLISRLYEIFKIRLISELPRLKITINNKLSFLKTELILLGKEKFSKNNSPILIHHYCDCIRESIEINDQYNSKDRRLFYSLNHGLKFKKIYDNLNLFIFQIRKSLKEETNDSNALFVSDKIFESIIKKGIEDLGSIMSKSTVEIFNLVSNHISGIKSDRFQPLSSRLNNYSIELLTIQHEKMICQLNEFIKIHSSFINMKHSDFSKADILAKIIKKEKKKNWAYNFINNSSEAIILDNDFEYNIIVSLSTEYFGIIKKTFIDYFIKLVNFYFINFLKFNLQTELSQFAFSLEDTLFEDGKITLNKRLDIEKQIKGLETGLAILEDET